MPKPFLLIVVDRDKNEFSVEGPMVDDTPWIDAVCAAQKAGRRVNCHTPGSGLDKETCAIRYQEQYGELEVADPGTIVNPQAI